MDQAPDSSTRPDPLDSWVEGFVRRLEESGEVDLERYCADAPPELASQLRQRCADVLVLRRVLPAPLAARAPQPPAPGQTLGDFRLLSEIGRGAMGVVYLARQVSLQRLVALKVLYPQHSNVERSLERFRREARSVARLRHPSICPVFAVGEERGLHFFAMQFVDGRSLDSEIHALRRRRAEMRGPAEDERVAIDPERSYEAQIAELVASLADALHYAHEQGVVHRDVKPHNVLIGRDGRAYLVDFGLAKDREEASLSRSGEVAGTLQYMSPEQAEGRRSELDARADVYSLGVVLYELLTLDRPFKARTTHQLLLDIACVLPPPPRKLNTDVPRDLEVICLHAMEKAPERRYSSAAEFAADLRRFLAHRAIHARPASLARRAVHRARRHRGALVGGGAAAAVLVGLGWVRADVQAQERARDTQARLERVDIEAAFDAADPVALASALELARSAGGYSGALAPQAIARAADIERRIREYARTQLDTALAELDAVDDGQRAELLEGPWREFAPPTAPDQAKFQTAMERMRFAELAGPHESEARVSALRAEGSTPRLTVRTEQPGADVWLRRVELERLGEPEWLGATPLENVVVAPGAYRVVVSQGGAFAELTRVFARPRHHYALDVRPVTVAQAQAGMLFVPAGKSRLRSILEGEDTLREVELEGFWIDRCEVSNAEYRRYMDATGAAPPTPWLSAEFKVLDFDAVAALPVVGIHWAEALQYAEWAGKRLPTFAEWQVAARGREGWTYPWGESDEALTSRANLPHVAAKGASTYLDRVVAVDSYPDGASPFGALHMLDNVSEWCADLAPTRAPRVSLRNDTVLFAGGSFVTAPDAARLSMASSASMDNVYLYVGLRCAKSAQP